VYTKFFLHDCYKKVRIKSLINQFKTCLTFLFHLQVDWPMVGALINTFLKKTFFVNKSLFFFIMSKWVSFSGKNNVGKLSLKHIRLFSLLSPKVQKIFILNLLVVYSCILSILLFIGLLSALPMTNSKYFSNSAQSHTTMCIAMYYNIRLKGRVFFHTGISHTTFFFSKIQFHTAVWFWTVLKNSQKSKFIPVVWYYTFF
jgi:hypothetical protein